MKKLRILFVAVLSTLLMPFASGQAAADPYTSPVEASFTLNARVLDSGQQIVSLTINAPDLGVKASSLSADTFSVHAKGTNPYSSLDPKQFFSEYDVDRTVTGVHVDRRGRIVIALAHGYQVEGASTLGWANDVGRNIVLDLDYTVTQNKPITLRDGSTLTFSALTQGRVVDREVDAYGSGSAAGLKYRLFDPDARGKRPLIIWLHGGGEGGWTRAYDNDLPLLANRGALGFSTRKAQDIFGGAYVLVPQATDYWLNDPAMGYSAKLKRLINKVVRQHRIDKKRIYVVGASNGGYMTAKLVADNPRFFAADVPICPVLEFDGTTMITDAELAAVRTPTWVVQAKSDDVVPFETNGKHLAETVPGALLSAYDDVVWKGVEYPPHWSWIYVARNDPENAKGQHIWQWMAKQRLHR